MLGPGVVKSKHIFEPRTKDTASKVDFTVRPNFTTQKRQHAQLRSSQKSLVFTKEIDATGAEKVGHTLGTASSVA